MNFEKYSRAYFSSIEIDDLYFEVTTLPGVNLDESEVEVAMQLPLGKAPIESFLRILIEGRSNKDLRYKYPDEISELADVPMVLVEQSPAKAMSLREVVEVFSDAPGAAAAIAITGATPWLVLTIPAGIIVFRVSREVGAALGEVAGDWIRKLKPKEKEKKPGFLEG